MYKRSASPRGFTIIEAVLACAVLSVALLAMYVTISRASELSEINKQIKIAIFDAQSIVEEIQGMPFDEIMDPDYPTFSTPAARYRHLQEVAHERIFGIDKTTNKPNPPHLEDEKIRVWYGEKVDLKDENNNGDYSDALPLPIESGADKAANLAPPPFPEKNRPAKNAQLEFITPDPLYITVEVSWVGPQKVLDDKGEFIRMFQRITFVRSR